MMTKDDERKIIDSLANDDMLELKSDDLEQMLQDELSKPESEIDGQLVKEILDVMEPDEPDPAQMQASWLHVKENLLKRQGEKKWHARFVRYAAAIVVMAIVLVSTTADAGAFRWTLIQKILKPVAETFGILIEDETDTPLENADLSMYSVSDVPSELVTYRTLEEVPEMHDGYIIRPKWIPEGFAFAGGSRFSDFDSEIYSLDFARDERRFNLNVHIITVDFAVYAREFEQNLAVPIEKTIGQHAVTFYSNTDDRHQSAVWIHENAHYLLYGELSVEDVTEFILKME